MFKIENDIPYDPSRKTKFDIQKQALLNTVSLLKPGQSIFVSSKDLPVNATNKYFEEVLQKNYGIKKLVKRPMDVDGIKGIRIWSNPENKL